MTKIVIADMNALSRESLVGFLKNAHPSHDVYGVESELNFDLIAHQSAPCFFLMDQDFYQTMDIKDLDRIKEHKIFVLMDIGLARGSLLHASVSGIISKNVPLQKISENIDIQLESLKSLDACGRFESDLKRRNLEDAALTKRERQVLRHLLKGKGNKEIARLMEIETVTVKLHIRNLCRKLSVSNRTQAAIVVFENGWDRDL
jgi:DNA-binding NarL/FixJ family response regulator